MFTGGVCEPKPEGTVPLWIPLAWGRVRMPAVIARWADGFSVAPHLASATMVRSQIERVHRACEDLGRDPASLRSNRLVGVTLTDKTVDPAAAKRRLLEEADVRTRQVMDAAGQYWRDILHAQWPDDVPTAYTFEDFYEVTEFHCVGTPEQVAEQISTGVGEFGIDEAVVWPHGMLRSWEPPCVAAQAELVERFAVEVMPLLEVQ